MRRALLTAVAVQAALATAVGGCQQILGGVGGDQCDTCDGGLDGAGDRGDEGESAAPDGSAEGDAPADGGEQGDGEQQGDGGDADAESQGCLIGATRCDDTGSILETCQADGGWSSQPCPAYCFGGACMNPPSCSALGGCSGNISCCAARNVPGGTFIRSYDGVTDNGNGKINGMFSATISPVSIDLFEVTVSRFANFVAAYDSWKPDAGDGKDPNDPDDKGWDPSWNANLQPTASALKAELNCSVAPYQGTWANSSVPPANNTAPITCVDWYTAFAFCIWDGGRLPTEAEWNFAAAGGDEQRVYPWSSPPSDQTIDATHATYSPPTGPGLTAPTAVGVTSAGAGKWGHFDLAGNAEEWVRDWYVSPYPSSNCIDCADLTPSGNVVLRGGAYLYFKDEVSASFRDDNPPDANSVLPWFGFRCARSALAPLVVTDSGAPDSSLANEQ